MNKHIGSDFDDFLTEQGLLEETSAAALKKVITWQIQEAMKAQHMTVVALAKRMHTSRTVVTRVLDAEDAGMTIATLANAARALGQSVEVRLVPDKTQKPETKPEVVCA
ncbi:helix-turn-helix transcriptional regulator [Pseudomonas sp. DP16D-R1]|uniref:helix-turn-helix domain-containing protein n=1 Tax=Pseudomonas sp. DP16D-R1 TaxID=2075551 RepID=UPI000CD02B05|nr:helix-turn-helix transcriptional regulator [Pseudomonas sp. DP16D-R1]POA78016.1 Fis family transcriptional regulator [Pseudomonas sp. DP16D-R1]